MRYMISFLAPWRVMMRTSRNSSAECELSVAMHSKRRASTRNGELTLLAA